MLGPATNLARALQRAPWLAGHLKSAVLMGGELTGRRDFDGHWWEQVQRCAKEMPQIFIWMDMVWRCLNNTLAWNVLETKDLCIGLMFFPPLNLFHPPSSLVSFCFFRKRGGGLAPELHLKL